MSNVELNKIMVALNIETISQVDYWLDVYDSESGISLVCGMSLVKPIPISVKPVPEEVTITPLSNEQVLERLTNAEDSNQSFEVLVWENTWTDMIPEGAFAFFYYW